MLPMIFFYRPQRADQRGAQHPGPLRRADVGADPQQHRGDRAPPGCTSRSSGRRSSTPDEMTAGRILLIGGGTLLGIVVQAAGLLPALRKVGFRWRWRFDFRRAGPARAGPARRLDVLLRRGQPGRPDRGASTCSTGPASENAAGPLIFNNVFLLLMMAHGIIAVSIITALMPRMSAAAADGRYADVAADLSRGTRHRHRRCSPRSRSATRCWPPRLAVDAVPATARSPTRTPRPPRWCCSLAALALVPFAISQLFTFAFYALPDTRTPALINIPVVALRIGVQVGALRRLRRPASPRPG